MQRGSGGQGVDPGRRVGGDAPELGKVEERSVEVQRDVQPVADQSLVAKRAAQGRERASQRRARALRIGVGPEQVRDHRPGVRVAGDCQERQDRRRLAGVDDERLSVDLDARRAEQCDAE